MTPALSRSSRQSSTQKGLHECERERMADPAQDSAVRLPQSLRLLDFKPQRFKGRLHHSPLNREALGEDPGALCQGHAPHQRHHELDADRQAGGDQKSDAHPADRLLGHSLVSPSSRPATGAIATTWSSGAIRMTITPWVWRPICEMAPTGVRRTMPLALMTSTSSSGSVTTRMAASLPTRSVTLRVKTPCPARWCIGYSLSGVRLP